LKKAELLLEIGTEEIPAGFLEKALVNMKGQAAKMFESARVTHGEIITMGAPRRLMLLVRDLTEMQKDKVEKIMGPPVNVAYDEDGAPTKTAMGFAKNQGVDIYNLETEIQKGREVVCAIRHEHGRQTAELLQDLLPQFISDIHFPKNMRWMDLDIRFARPIHWILAIFDGIPVSFNLDNINSGQHTYGHRYMHDKSPIIINNFESYLTETRDACVLADHKERKAEILKQINAAAAEADCEVMLDENLLTEVNFLVEYPYTLLGKFSEDFLTLPPEVLINTMKKHQKYFSVQDNKGNLQPYFIGVCNIKPKNDDLVRGGMERVLLARLRDAQFFYDEDLKSSLDEMAKRLKGVIFQKKLGTSWEKVERFRLIANKLAEELIPEKREAADRAAMLCKADLESSMVYEFPELQGVMGREYALKTGEPAEVADAIHEHYLPAFADDKLPQSDIGALVGIADRIDTIVGCFGVGLIPSGTADPYALRRHTLAIINIILDKKYPLTIDHLVDLALDTVKPKLSRDTDEIRQGVLDFFRQRYFNLMVSRRFSNDVVDAAMATDYFDLNTVSVRIEAVNQLKGNDDFEPLAIAFKRVVNIIKEPVSGKADKDVFEETQEKALYERFVEVKNRVEEQLSKGDYQAMALTMAGLRESVDKFFDDVMVMADDLKLRENRLRLLNEIREMFFLLADFSKLATE